MVVIVLLSIIVIGSGIYIFLTIKDKRETIICPKCGKEILASKNKCKYCGFTFESAKKPFTYVEDDLEHSFVGKLFKFNLIWFVAILLAAWLIVHFS